MSINFAAITPHPPIIIPEIGKNETQKLISTTQALRQLSRKANEAEIDTLIIISPHGLTYPDRFNICGMEKLFGTFAHFNVPEISMEFKNNLELARTIDVTANKDGVPTLLYDNGAEFYELDHGILVPLYFLNRELETTIKVVPISYSMIDNARHFSFGQVIGKIAEESNERIGIVASGDLSHRLIGNSDYSQQGKEFDNKIISDLEKGLTQDILYYDQEFVEQAGECGYRSILILLGALNQNNFQAKVLSYEGPFGVGYAVISFGLEGKNE